MTYTHGKILGVAPLTHNGFPAWNLVIPGDGYQSHEIGTYRTNVDGLVAHLFATWPYRGLTRAIDVFRVDVASVDSTPDDLSPGGHGAIPAGLQHARPGFGLRRRTYFDARFRFRSKSLSGNTRTVVRTVNRLVPSWDVAVVLVNSDSYGGAGDTSNRVIYCSRAPGAHEILLHELGHSGFGLGDEYSHSSDCVTDLGRDRHPLLEPAAANVTVTMGPLKWANYVRSAPTPKVRNPDCRTCDSGPNPFDADTVGLFEGAAGYHCGAYRPQYSCRMRRLGQPYCVVCQDRILASLADRLPTGMVASRSTGWVMDIAMASTSDNATVQLCPPRNTPNQRFRVNPAVGGWYQVQTGVRVSARGARTPLVLDVAGASTSPGARIQQYARNGGANQEFDIDPLGNGYVRILARHSQLVAEVDSGSPRPGPHLQQALWTGETNQQWIPFVELQSGWRVCGKCQALFLGPLAEGVCPSDGPHLDISGVKYALGYNLPPLANWQMNWRCCSRCRGLFLAAAATRCVAGGTHDPSTSLVYSLACDAPAWKTTGSWQCCRKCQGVFATRLGASYCPTCGPHEALGNTTYSALKG